MLFRYDVHSTIIVRTAIWFLYAVVFGSRYDYQVDYSSISTLLYYKMVYRANRFIRTVYLFIRIAFVFASVKQGVGIKHLNWR